MIKLSGLVNNQWVSEPINIKSYFEEYEEKLSLAIKALQTSGVDNYNLETMSSVMGIPETTLTTDRFHELISYCGEDKLDVQCEPCSLKLRRVTSRHSLFSRSQIPSSKVCDLATLKHLRQVGKKKETKVGLKYANAAFIGKLVALRDRLRRDKACFETFMREISDYFPYIAIDIFDYSSERFCRNNEERGKSDLTVKKDVVITIRVHDTVYPVENYPKPAKPFSQEMMVLGSQSLTCLRDKIICTTDYRATHSETEKMIFEDEEERKNHLRAKDQFKSGLFFFEDTFYNDMRHPANIDYSKVIREWAERKKIGPLHEGSMAETKFEDLTIRFGYPYVYQHQGNCEHLIIFSDASLLHESDVCEKKRYPVVKSIGTKTNLSCMICHYYHARWITFGNERVPVDPCYFCDQCFKSYNYIGKEKIGKFKVYEYHPFFPFHDKLFSK